MKTLILLIDFYGHPALTTDRYNDSIRYSALTEIISSSFIDRKNCAIFSTSIPQNDKRLLELKLSDEEIRIRKKNKERNTDLKRRGYDKIFHESVLQADKGADFDFLRFIK